MSILLECVDHRVELAALEGFDEATLSTLGKACLYAMKKAIAMNAKIRAQKKWAGRPAAVRSQACLVWPRGLTSTRALGFASW